MKFEKVFPLRFLLNLGRREDRRVAAEAELLEGGVQFERFAAVDAERISSAKLGDTNSSGFRGYESAGRYALALTQRMAIREAKRRKASAVLLFEDDIVLHPNFSLLIETVEIPEDWGIFYLGCAHHSPPKWAGTRVVRAKFAVDTHAVAIREPYYDVVMEILDRHMKPELGVAGASDQFLALLHAEVPAYACYPNLAWQRISSSDLVEETYSNYTSDGRQKNFTQAIDFLLPELGRPNSQSLLKREPCLGLLFLTRGDVNHPDIWSEFVKEAPDRVRVFSHPKALPRIDGGFLSGTAIKARQATQWGTVSLVKAARYLLSEALLDPSLTHFVLLSESCVPVKPLPEILRKLRFDPRPQFSYKTLADASEGEREKALAVKGIPAGCWRFQPQWWLLDRIAAMMAVGTDFTEVFGKMFVPDESYFATVLSLQGYPLDGEVNNSPVTWTYWEKGAGSPNEWTDLPPGQLALLIASNALFARKFSANSKIGTLGLHRSEGYRPDKTLED